MEYTYEKLKDLLATANCSITFTKIDEEVRTMPCTLRAEHLPPLTETKTTKPVNTNSISVWCLDKQEWRSFRIANVTKVEIIG